MKIFPGSILCFLGFAMAWGNLARAQNSSPAAPPRDFLFGIELDPHASDAAKELFYETGMNCVRMTGGGYAWAAQAHKDLADDFAKRGLKVYMQLGSHYPSASYFPLTDSYLVDQDGKSGTPDKKVWAVTYSGEAWPQYSYSSAPFREMLTKDFTAYVGKFGDNKNIAGVILHNEAGYFWLKDRVFDYNPVTVDGFRKWLEQQDGTIAALNARWGTSYAAFTEVVPPGKPPETNLAAWMDWRHYNVEVIAGFMKWEAGLFRSLRPDVPCTTNLDGPLNNWYGYRCANLLAYSAPMDRVGIDIYPTPSTTRDFVPYATDMVQGIAQGREGNVLECDSFSGNWNKYDEETRGGMLRSELWTMFGHGTSGVLVWGFDTFAKPDATFNPRILACRDIAHQARMIGLGNFQRRKSRVALCVDPDSYLYLGAIEKSPLSLTSGLDHEYEGFHAALDDAGIQSDVIFAAQINSGVLKNYDAVVIPSPMMMDETMAAQLKDFVSGGGTLIAVTPFAGMDRWGKPLAIIPGFGLDQIFGCTVAEGGKGGPITSLQGAVSTWEATALTVHGADILGTFPDGSPAITSNVVGKGRAILIGGKAGQPYLDSTTPDALSLVLGGLLKQSGIVPMLEGQMNGHLSISSIADTRGNVLVVPSLQTSKGEAPNPVKDMKIIYRGDDAGNLRSGYVFPPTTSEGGVVRSGPIPVTLTPDLSDKSVSFQLPEIKSALPVLLTKETGPLIATEAPAEMTNGQEATVTVTCFNPSAQSMQGQLEVRAGSVTVDAGGKTPVEIPPYGQKEVSLKVKMTAPAPVARVPLTVVLTPTGSPEVEGIPVDIAVK